MCYNQSVDLFAIAKRYSPRLQKNATLASAVAIKSVGVIGAGTMGAAIAAAHAAFGIPVHLHDSRPEVLVMARQRMPWELQKYEKYVCTEAGPISYADDLRGIATCDLIIESIVEKLSAKLDLYRQLQDFIGPQTIVVTNTSTIPVEKLSVGFSDASRFCGFHFCHPVAERPLVEIVQGTKTSNTVVAAVEANAQRIGRIAIIVPDSPGFIVNRLLFPYLDASLLLLQQGVDITAIEQAALDFGMLFGPFRMMDEIGLDTILHSGLELASAFPGRMNPSPILVSLVKRGHLGRKTARGFFDYDDGGKMIAISADACNLIAQWCDSFKTLPVDELQYQLFLPMFFEAARILKENQTLDLSAIDLAVMFGLGFPVSKGGLLHWAKTIGYQKIKAIASAQRDFLEMPDSLEMLLG